MLAKDNRVGESKLYIIYIEVNKLYHQSIHSDSQHIRLSRKYMKNSLETDVR